MNVLADQTAIVTGASRGIGRAVALELARHGAAVAVNYLSQRERAEDVVSEIVSAGGRAAPFQADVSDSEAVKNLVSATSRRLDHPDILVANAGVVSGGLFATGRDSQWQRMLSVNLLGTVNCVREVLPAMVRRRRGSIVCLSSIVAERGAPGLSAYAAAKGGVLSLVRTLAVELGKKKIRINAVAPGLINTEMTRVHVPYLGQFEEHIPLRRMGEPEEVARAVRFLASDDASYITGETLRVGGGLGE